MLKLPADTYRVFQVDRKGPDGKVLVTSDGEISARFVQRKSELRKGQRVSLFHAMKGPQLDRMAIAGGKGCTNARSREACCAVHVESIRAAKTSLVSTSGARTAIL
jgi:hypothetical protein